MSRRVCYISGIRADFGLMQATLLAVDRHPDLELDVLVTGMHLSSVYGHTVDEIVATGLKVRGTVAVELDPATGANMARNIGIMICRFVELLDAKRPDLVLLLGDRGEMLAGAIAALHLNVPVVHIHGGERSGTVDDRFATRSRSLHTTILLPRMPRAIALYAWERHRGQYS